MLTSLAFDSSYTSIIGPFITLIIESVSITIRKM
jgi:hypothetical protein